MSKKRILIFSHAMELGGAERALLGLLEAIDYSKVEVDLFLMRHSGELLDLIPEEVTLLPELPAYSCLAVPAKEVIRKGQLRVAYGRWRGKRKAQERIKELNLPADNDVALQYSHLHTLKAMPPVGREEYDLAISFLTPHYYVAEKVKAKKRVAWIHTDYSKVAIDVQTQLQMWRRYDYIAAISEAVSESFAGIFPELSDKMVLIKNMIPIKTILRQSGAFSVEKEMPDDGYVKLLSIGRFCYAKNFDSVPSICKLLIEAGKKIKWYLIGYGGDEELICRRIREQSMEKYVIILGKKENPYPYIQNCDIYVQPSRYEGYSVSVREAQALGKPVIITAYPTSASQLEDGVDGVIVSMDIEGCAKGIEQVLENPKLIRNLKEYCKVHDYSNKAEVCKIYDLL